MRFRILHSCGPQTIHRKYEMVIVQEIQWRHWNETSCGLADGYYGFERNVRRLFEDPGSRFPTSVMLTPWKQLDVVPSASGTRRRRRWSSWILSPARVVWAVLRSLAFLCGSLAAPETRHRCGASRNDFHPLLPWKHTGLQLICLDEKLGIYYAWISVRCLFVCAIGRWGFGETFKYRCIKHGWYFCCLPGTAWF